MAAVAAQNAGAYFKAPARILFPSFASIIGFDPRTAPRLYRVISG